MTVAAAAAAATPQYSICVCVHHQQINGLYDNVQSPLILHCNVHSRSFFTSPLSILCRCRPRFAKNTNTHCTVVGTRYNLYIIQ